MACYRRVDCWASSCISAFEMTVLSPTSFSAIFGFTSETLRIGFLVDMTKDRIAHSLCGRCS
jgi:hypothetical protein